MPTIEEVNLLAAKLELDRVNRAIETGDLSLLKPTTKREREYKPRPKPLSREERRRIKLADGQTFADVHAFIEACGIHISQLDKLLWSGWTYNRIAVKHHVMAHAYGQDAPPASNVGASYPAGEQSLSFLKACGSSGRTSQPRNRPAISQVLTT